MRDIEAIIDGLLEIRPEGFRSGELARALGVSRGRASQIIAKRLRTGELKRVGSGPGPYKRGDGEVAPWNDEATHFWRSLTREHPHVIHVSLGRLLPSRITYRHQIQMLMQALQWRRRARYVLFDFGDVLSLGEAAAEELYGPYTFSRVFINAVPEIARALRRAAATVG